MSGAIQQETASGIYEYSRH